MLFETHHGKRDGNGYQENEHEREMSAALAEHIGGEAKEVAAGERGRIAMRNPAAQQERGPGGEGGAEDGEEVVGDHGTEFEGDRRGDKRRQRANGGAG